MTNMIAVSFAEESRAYQAMSVLKDTAAAGRVGLVGAALIESDESGTLRIPDAVDATASRASTGGLVGLLLGVLGGPVGMLVGWGTGALVGSALDVDRIARAQKAVAEFSRTIPAGTTVLVGEVDEHAVEVLDVEMGKLGGVVQRRTSAEVLAEIEAAEAAEEEQERAAHQAASDQKWLERRARFQQRRARARARLGLDQDTTTA